LKKVISILLLLLTLATNAFVKASLHYCGESITQIAFGNEKGDPCDCAETGNMDCCKDVVVKLSPFNDTILSAHTNAPILDAQDVIWVQFDSMMLLHQPEPIRLKILKDTGPPLLAFKQQAAFLSIFRI
jgi:hypothetical protein